MGSIGPLELIIIVFIIVLIFGARKLPELGGALGKSIKEFRNSTAELREPPSNQAPTTTSNAPTATTKQCPNCSSSNDATNTFCGSCGAKLP